MRPALNVGDRLAAAGPIPVFFINRDVDEERRAAVETEVKSAGLVGERLRAVEGLSVPESLKPYFFESGKLHSDLRPGEVGCYASHLMIHQLVVERGLPYALVIEDDAVLAPDFQKSVRYILAGLPKSWDAVHLFNDPPRAVKPLGEVEPGRMLVRYSRIPAGTVGYLISRQGAQKFLRPVKRYWPVDTDFRRPWLFDWQVFGVVPPIVSHREDTPTSPIGLMGGRSRRRRGIQFPSREAWTGNPLHCPESFYFNVKALGPIWWARCLLLNVGTSVARGLARLYGR